MAIHNMSKVVSLVERATGRATSVVFTGSINSGTIGKVLLDNVSRDATLMTDEARHYRNMGTIFAGHLTVVARQLETDNDPDRFRDRLGKLVKHRPAPNMPDEQSS